MAGNMSLLNPFVFNQFGAYGAAAYTTAQVRKPAEDQGFGAGIQNMFLQQQAALMAAATAQGTYINPMAALATQIPHAALNGMANSVVPPTTGERFYYKYVVRYSYLFTILILTELIKIIKNR